LAHYLKALGVFRVVAEQLDDSARARWQGDALVLQSDRVDRQRIEQFFLEEYRPAPIVSPWNKSSGFDDKSTPELDVILGSESPRLQPYRSAIRIALDIAGTARREGLSKDDLLLRCRARLPDDALAWLDAAVVLSEGGPAFPPLLGTGGNLGRLELSRNYMAHVALVVGLGGGRRPPSEADVRSWLASGLFGEGSPTLIHASIAQYDPGPAGGANMAPDGKAESIVNPWDFVLVLEGALLFASAAARRLGTDARSTAAMPFTTAESRVGYASSSAGEPARGELWAPIWSRAMSLPELARLVAEGRAEWQGRQARSGLDFVRAIASLGTDRGVDQFVRHAFVDRLGQMALAVPVGVVTVKERPEVRLLGELDHWLRRIRNGANQPAAVVHALQAVDLAMYEAATQVGPEWLQRLLTSVAGLHGAVERAASFRARTTIGPLSDLVADRWLPQLDDHSDEFAVAASLASSKDRNGWGLRALLSAVRDDDKGYLRWADRSAPVMGLGVRPVQDVLAEALQRHAVERSRTEDTPEGVDEFDHIGKGLDLGFAYQRGCPLGAALAASRGELHERRLSDLLQALLILNWRPREGTPRHPVRSAEAALSVPPAAAIALPFFHGLGVTFRQRRLLLRAGPAWPRLLAVGRVGAVVEEARLRLRMAGLAPPSVDADRAGLSTPGAWLAVAAMCRLSEGALRSLLNRAVPPDVE
jgi:CRISPR-associated protein Csx17